MSPSFADITPALLLACGDFWTTYYTAMRNLHLRSGRTLQEPIRDRNLGTTVSNHIKVFEQFWRKQLALALGVPEADVRPRKIHFRTHRSKNFDVCWPPTGDPLILISVKSMQNAYRNLTNRVEEAFGDSAVLRLYKSNAVFGFFFFILNGRVAAGQAEQDISLRATGAKGVAPYLEPIEEGGDFFDLSDVDRYRKKASGRRRKGGRQDTIRKAEQSLLDLAAAEPAERGGIPYDAIAFTPARVKRVQPARVKRARKEGDTDLWDIALSEVDEMLDPRTFLSRLLTTARLRGFIK
jgi:hypothetical protein